MARVRADPVTTALAHPTRRAVYLAPSHTSDEMSTVQIETTTRQSNSVQPVPPHEETRIAWLGWKTIGTRGEPDGGGRQHRWNYQNCSKPQRAVQPPTATHSAAQPSLLQQRPQHCRSGVHEAVEHGGEVRVISLDWVDGTRLVRRKCWNCLAQQHGIHVGYAVELPTQRALCSIAKKR